MRNILRTDYSSRICTELNCNVPSFILFHFLFYLTYLRRHLYCIAAYCQLLILNEYRSINQSIHSEAALEFWAR